MLNDDAWSTNGPAAPELPDPAEDPAFDALAELFLGDAESASSALQDTEEARPPRDAPARKRVEAIVLGHLPVMASPWVAQRAASLAERLGAPVALARLVEERLTIEIHRPRAQWPAEPAQPAPTVTEALGRAAAECAHWAVSVDAVDEPALVRSALMDGATVLSGADQAAVVAGYRAFKQLSARLGAREGFTWRLAVVGAADDAAAQAAERLQDAAATYLDCRLDVQPPIPRIEALRPARLYDGPTDWTMQDLAAGVRTARPPAMTRPAEARDEPSRPSLRLTKPGVAGSEPRPQSESLSSYLKGVRALRARCPYRPEIELAVDERGALQLLARAGGDVMEALEIVEAWAQDHAELVSMTSEQARGIDVSLPVARRLFTERPAEVRRLLDGDVRVHLLAPVTLRGETAWASVELN